MTDFANKKWNDRKKRTITKFGEPIMIKAGKRINIRQMIEENSIDTRIYEQIDKYGMNPIQEIPIEETVQDYTELATDLRTSLDRGRLARKMWTNLPREIRNEFDNDIERFTTEGANWLSNKFEEITKAKLEAEKLTKQTEGKENVKE